MFDLNLYEWGILSLAAFLIGVTKTGIPGVGILAVLLAANTLPAKESTGFILPLLIMGDIFAVVYYKRHAVLSHIIKLIPWTIGGVFIGYYFMGKIDDNNLKIVIGIIVLAMMGINYWLNSKNGNDLNIPKKWWFAGIFGLLVGIATMMANAAGPVFIIYLLSMRLNKYEFMGSGAWFFLFLNLFKVPFSINLGLIKWEFLEVNLMLLPMIFLGAYAGLHILKKIPQKIFEKTVEFFNFVAAIKLIFW